MPGAKEPGRKAGCLELSFVSAGGSGAREDRVVCQVGAIAAHTSGFISPSMVGISSETVGWMCMVRCSLV